MPGTARLIEALGCDDPAKRRVACEEIAATEPDREFVPYLVKALGDRDHGVSEAAMNALMSIGGDDVVRGVTPLLADGEARLRNRAIEILIAAGTIATGPVSTMLDDIDDDVVKFAVDILAGIEDTAPAERVARLLKHDNPNVRGAAALYMGRARPEGAASHITEALDDAEQWVRFSAIEALGYLGDIRYLEPLLEIVRQEEGLLREAALDALSRMATTANSYEILMTLEASVKDAGIIPAGSIVGILEKAAGAPWDVGSFINLGDMLFKVFDRAACETDPETRKTALKGFALTRDGRGLKRVLEFIDDQEELDEETAEFIDGVLVDLFSGARMPEEAIECIVCGEDKKAIPLIEAAGRLRAVEALPALEKALGNASKETARAILRTFDEIGSPESEKILRKSLYSPDGHVRKMAAMTLVRIAGEAVTDDLFSVLLREKYPDVIKGISEALASIGTPGVRKGFENLLKSKRSDMREVACRGLGMMGGDDSVAPLVEATGDSEGAVRRAAYVALSMLGTPGAVGAIIKGLNLGERDISIAILDSIDSITTDELRAAVRGLLGDPDLWVRHHAATLLGEMMDSDAEEDLLKVLEEDAPPVKAAAAGALARLASMRAVPVLKNLYADSDPSLRSAIERAIEEIGC